MNRKFKMLGLSIVAVLAMTAVSASAAQAVSFHSESQTTFYTGEQGAVQNVFTTTAGTVKCKKANFTGEATATGGSGTDWTTPTVSVTPSYAECTAFGQAATVTSGTCTYTLDASGVVTGIDCSSGLITVHVTSGNCTVTVGAQTFPGGGGVVDYSNAGATTTRDVLVTATVTNKIDYTVDGPGTICGTAGSYADEGSYTGTVTTKGYKNAGHTEHTGVWVS